jgi:hypothetical protein
VGEDGAILRFDGSYWQRVPGGPVRVEDVSVAAPDDVYVVGYRPPDWGVFRWNGSGWVALPAFGDCRLRAVVTTGPGEVWAGGGDPESYRDDGCLGRWTGTSWEAVEWRPPVPDIAVTRMSAAGPDEAWAVSNRREWSADGPRPFHGTLLHWTREHGWTVAYSFSGRQVLDVAATSGAAWVAIESWGVVRYSRDAEWLGLPNVRGVWSSDSGEAWAVGNGIHRYDGRAWIETPATSGVHVRDLWGSGPSDVWAIGTSGRLIHWNGAVWENAWAGLDDGGTAVHVGSDGVVTLGVHDQRLQTWDGAEWTVSAVPRPWSRTVSRIFGVLPDEIWVVTDGGGLAVGERSGWTTVEGPFEGARLEDLAPIGSRESWLTGCRPSDVVGDVDRFLALRTNDGWTVASLDAASGALWRDPARRLWTAGAPGEVRVLDHGAWRRVPLTGGSAVSDLTGDLAGVVEALAEDGTVHRIETDGAVWSLPAGSEAELEALWTQPSGHVSWAVGREGAVLRRTRYEWRRLRAPTIAPLSDVAGSADGDAWIVGRGVVLHAPAP